MRRLPISRSLSFGNFHSKAHALAIGTVIISVVHGLLAQSGYFGLLFSPFQTLFGLELWRPFTSLFVAASPLEVIFGAFIIYSIGGMLESRWSEKRFLAVAIGIPLIAEVILLITTLCAPSIFIYAIYSGSRQVVTTLWIVFGLSAHFSHELLNFWGTPVKGRTFALIGVGFVVLSGVFGGFMPVLPEVITVAICYLYMYRHRAVRVKNQLQLRYYDWKLQKLKNRSNLRVIKGSRQGSRKSDDDDEPGPQIH